MKSKQNMQQNVSKKNDWLPTAHSSFFPNTHTHKHTDSSSLVSGHSIGSCHWFGSTPFSSSSQHIIFLLFFFLFHMIVVAKERCGGDSSCHFGCSVGEGLCRCALGFVHGCHQGVSWRDISAAEAYHKEEERRKQKSSAITCFYLVLFFPASLT